jgi:hypothetical protein
MKNGTPLDLLLQSLGDARPEELDGLASGIRRTLTVDEMLRVSGGMMKEPTTCSGGCADDCGSP